MTAPLAIVAGIPLEVHRRARNRPARAGWAIRAIPSHDRRRADLSGIWARVMEAADRAPNAGVHLLLAHDRESDRPRFGELVCRCHRATWLPRGLSGQYGKQKFLEAFDEIMDFEEEWRARIRPRIASPLLLPETVFVAAPSVKDTWSRARNVNRERDNLHAVEQTIGRFGSEHRHPGCWRDRRDLIFCHGPRHGSHGLPEWRRRKFTIRFPDGFHFDVRHFRNGNFHVRAGAETRRFTTYTNVDPHGFLRGGR